MIDQVIDALSPRLVERAWLISDLQQTLPDWAERNLRIAVEDALGLKLDFNQVWYLGDGTEGADAARLDQMVRMQIGMLARLDAPIRYIMGNHDFDPLRKWMRSRSSDADAPDFPVAGPLYEAAGSSPGWISTASTRDFYFLDRFGGYTVLFLTDHCAADGSWYTSHDRVHGDPESYPHPPAAYRRLADELAALNRPIVSAGHYPFPGGNRANPGGLLTRLLPLCPGHVAHFYGHSHIGDLAYGKDDAYRKICSVSGHRVPQINVSSLDTIRGDEVRSVVLDVYEDDTLGLYFRHHGRGEWAEALLLNPKPSREMGVTRLESWPPPWATEES
ncbi:MAG: metallophosphoesterase [Phycisphaeraceae bacterium]|nr:metallophosphoesterase [Phycisphaeraceae bacterium]